MQTQVTQELEPQEQLAYEVPSVVSYEEEAVLQMLGPAQTVVSSTFP